MIIKIFTEFEKRVEDISETFKKEIWKKPEIKNTINENKNTPGGISSRLEQAKEQISDPDDGIIQSS